MLPCYCATNSYTRVVWSDTTYWQVCQLLWYLTEAGALARSFLFHSTTEVMGSNVNHRQSLQSQGPLLLSSQEFTHRCYATTPKRSRYSSGIVGSCKFVPHSSLRCVSSVTAYFHLRVKPPLSSSSSLSREGWREAALPPLSRRSNPRAQHVQVSSDVLSQCKC